MPEQFVGAQVTNDLPEVRLREAQLLGRKLEPRQVRQLCRCQHEGTGAPAQRIDVVSCPSVV